MMAVSESARPGGPFAVESEAAEPPRIGFFVRVAHYRSMSGRFSRATIHMGKNFVRLASLSMYHQGQHLGGVRGGPYFLVTSLVTNGYGI